MHNRTTVGLTSLSVVPFPPSAFSGCHSLRTRPDDARAWGLATWGHDPCPEGRSARHLQLPVDCPFCHAAVGDLAKCLSECPWFEDLQMEWCRRCCIPVLAASVWSRHWWIFDTTSLLNSPGTLRSCEICWCSVSAISFFFFGQVRLMMMGLWPFSSFCKLLHNSASDPCGWSRQGLSLSCQKRGRLDTPTN